MGKVKALFSVKEDARGWTPEEMLKDTVREWEEGKLPMRPNKGIVILLEKREGYDTMWRQAGMSDSEIVALLEIVKQEIIRDMR